jgi:hypothetical protein
MAVMARLEATWNIPLLFEPSNLVITDPNEPDLASTALNWQTVKLSEASL